MAPPKEIIIGCVLAALMCLGLSPLLAANSNPDRSVQNLKVLVVDFEAEDGFTCGDDDEEPGEDFGCGRYLSEHGFVGVKLRQFLELAASQNKNLPSFQFKSSEEYPTPESLKDAVRDRLAWGAIWVNAKTSAGIAGALKHPADSAWDPRGAIGFAYDEARNNVVAASRIGGTCRGILLGFSAFFGGQVAVDFRNTLKRDELVVNPLDRLDEFLLSTEYTSFLMQPVSFTEFNLAPFDVPVMSQAQVIGNILMYVFSFLVTSVVFKALGPQFVGLSVLKVALRRYVAALVMAGIVSAAYATMVVGLANSARTGHEEFYKGDGPTWAKIWSVHYLLMMLVISLFLSVATLASSPDAIGPVLLPFLLWSVLSISSTDLAPEGYQFFWGAPMRYSTDLTKHVVFGTGNGVVVNRACGVLFGWLFFWGGVFFAVSLWRGQAGLDKTIPKKNDAGPGAKVGDNGKEGKETGTGTEMVSRSNDASTESKL